jgi:hypothetical protein
VLLSPAPAEAAALRAHNAALAEELEGLQAALREVGAEREAAVVAAEAGALCAEAEAARARDAAGHMMVLADQVQGMFALCEVSGGGGGAGARGRGGRAEAVGWLGRRTVLGSRDDTARRCGKALARRLGLPPLLVRCRANATCW